MMLEKLRGSAEDVVCLFVCFFERRSVVYSYDYKGRREDVTVELCGMQVSQIESVKP